MSDRADFRGFVIGVLVVIAGLIGLIYVVVDALKDKPGALAIVIFFILLPTSAWAIFGAVQSARRTHAESNQSDVVAADYEVLPARPQPRLSAPSFIPIDDHLMVRKTQIENAAATVYMRMWPHTAPTRANIMKQFPQMQSAGFVSAVQAYLRERGRVAGGGQGREYSWVVEDEDE